MSSEKQALIDKIKELKKAKNAIVLAHCYQNVEIDEVADFVGDSLYLSQQAAKTDANIIIFAGVYFMAETAKILSPNKKVLLPRRESGCLMADMINYKQAKEFKEKNGNLPFVCYVNSPAEVKAVADICCTSSNAINVVKSLNTDKVLFGPDNYLGKYVESQLDGVEVITYKGCCPIHLGIKSEDVLEMKEKYPNAKVLAHPECDTEVTKLADYIGSTTGIMKYAKDSDAKQFIIVTELGVVERLKRDFKDKEFFLISDKAVCANMKWHYLEDIYNALEKEEFEITVDEEVAKMALQSIERMVQINS